MKRGFWIILAVAISSIVYVTIRYGLRPKPVPVMNATAFENSQDIGAVIYKRLRQTIRPERVLVLGSSPTLTGAEDVWSGLLNSASADKLRLVALFQLESLPVPELNLSGMELVQFTEAQVESGELMDLVKAKMGPGQLVVVHGQSLQMTHLLESSFSRKLDKHVGHPVLSISSFPVTLSADDAGEMQENCSALRSAGSDQARIECAAARVSRAMIRKRRDPEKMWSVVERHGLQEYVVFIYK